MKKFNENGKISWNSWNFTKFNDFQDSATLHETFVFRVQNQRLSGLDPGKLQNPGKTINFLKITKISPFLAEFHENVEISWNSWNFMKFNEFLDSATLHETFVFLAQNQGLSGLNTQKPKNPENPLISWKSPKFHYFWQNSWKICKMMQKPLFGGFCRFPGRHMLKTLLFL